MDGLGGSGVKLGEQLRRGSIWDHLGEFLKGLGLTMARKLTVVDLFCGAGGFSEGFRRAGFTIVTGIDNDDEALITYSYNFPEAKALKRDLSMTSDSDIANLINRRIDIVIGGPPCQGFSIAGKRRKNDPRNGLYKAYLYFIGEISPQAIVMENVPTILGLYNGKIAETIISDFEKLGYRTKVFTLLASDYGVPQNRRRTFFVGLKDKLSFNIPEPTTKFHKVTTHEAIGDLPLLEDAIGGECTAYTSRPFTDYQKMMRKDSRMLFNHWAVLHTAQTKSIISIVPDGGNYKNLPLKLQNTRRVNIAWTRMNSQKPCFTIDAGHNHHFHYKANRVPTVRECARMQSFPDRFRFFGKKTSQFRQVGNAVPPYLARGIAESVREALYGF